MDVKSFIIDATEKSLNVDKAIKEVDVAKEAVETARAAVETAKAGVETAKLGVASAKDELDALAEQAEEYGLSKAKFKEAVERMKMLLTDIGAIEAVDTEDNAPSKPKATRKRKAKDAVDPSTTASASEADGKSEEAASSVPEDDTTTAEADEATSPTPAETEVAAEVTPSDAQEDASALEADIAEEVNENDAIDELDNSFAESELLDLVSDMPKIADDVKVVLSSVVRLASWHATNVEKTALQVTPSPLSLDTVLEAEENRYLPANLRDDCTTALSVGPEALSDVISWFAEAVQLLADAQEEAIREFSFATTEAEIEQDTDVASDDETANDGSLDTDDMSEVLGDDSNVSEDARTIEDIELFTDSVEEDEATTNAEPEAEPAPAPAKPTPPPSRPAWLK